MYYNRFEMLISNYQTYKSNGINIFGILKLRLISHRVYVQLSDMVYLFLPGSLILHVLKT